MMKIYRKVLLVVLVAIGCAVAIALPFGIKIIREEGMEGVFKRKRAFTRDVMPDAMPIVDGAEKKARQMGLK